MVGQFNSHKAHYNCPWNLNGVCVWKGRQAIRKGTTKVSRMGHIVGKSQVQENIMPMLCTPLSPISKPTTQNPSFIRLLPIDSLVVVVEAPHNKIVPQLQLTTLGFHYYYSTQSKSNVTFVGVNVCCLKEYMIKGYLNFISLMFGHL